MLARKANILLDSTRTRRKILGTYLVVLAVPVHHPVLAVGADLQLEVGDVVRLLRLLGDGALCGDARQDFEELEVDLRREEWSRPLQTQSLHAMSPVSFLFFPFFLYFGTNWGIGLKAFLV